MKNRQIIHIDMNSFFATAEQQANPVLRNKPVIVTGSKSERTIIVASSVEAKKLGIKTGQLIFEAKRICPNVKVVVGEPRKYNHILKSLISIFSRYTDMVEIFSIDECFLDVTRTAKLHLTNNSVESGQVAIKNQTPSLKMKGGVVVDFDILNAINITLAIKDDIKREIGEYLTCSVGIAKNKFLAKLGSDLQKPDGLVVITSNHKGQIKTPKKVHKLQNYNSKEVDNYQSAQRSKLLGLQKTKDSATTSKPIILTTDEILLNSDPSDFCGIGEKVNNRLKKLGINSTREIREAPDWMLKKEFGVYGNKIKKWSFGIDNSPVVPCQNQKEAKSFSGAETFNKDLVSRDELNKKLYLLCEVLGAKMRSEGYWGRGVGLWVRYASFESVQRTKKQNRWICDGYEIFKYAKISLDKIELKEAVRAIGVSVFDVQPEKNVPRSISGDESEEKITKTIDLINNKYGDLSLFRASVCKMKPKKVVSGIGRKNVDFFPK